jgi:hypothetical protein
MTKSTGLRLALFALAASTSLSGLAAQTAPGGRPPRITPTVKPTQPTTPPQQPVNAATIKVDPKATALAESLEIIPPPEVTAKRLPGSIIIGRRTLSDELPSFGVKRSLTADQMRTATDVRLGEARVDFKPLLGNDRLALNIAGRLRTMTDLADVRGEQTRTFEGKRGLIVQSIVRYELKPGACATPANRGRLAQAGVPCASLVSDERLEAEMADPKSPRFVEGRDRAAMIAKTRQQRAAERAKVMAHVAELRKQMAGTGTRAQISARLGAQQFARYEKMTDDELANELANSGETTIEQAIFMPEIDAIDLATSAIGKNVLSQINLPAPKAKTIAAPIADKYKPTTIQLDRQMFVAGFTLGRTHRWSERIQKTINWCLLGCKETYFAEGWVEFNYGLGLRFPMEVTGTYAYEGKDKAAVTIGFKPIDGSPADFKAAGMPDEKLFGGKEFVAEVGFSAGLQAKLPVVGVLGTPPIGTSIDLTGYFPAPLKGGNFLPPAPGNPTKGEPHPIREIDFLGTRGNLGVIGAKLHPAVQVTLHSDKFTFDFEDLLAGTGPRAITTGETVPLAVKGDNQSSQFSIGDPRYNFSIGVTPGITANLFLDLAVWSTSFDYTLLLPQLEVKLPPGGAEFNCHHQTRCTQNFAVSPEGVKVTAGAEPQYDPATPEGQVGLAMQSWAGKFNAKWLPQCKDETCRVVVKLTSFGTKFSSIKKLGSNVAGIPAELAALDAPGSEAQKFAQQGVKDSQDRATKASVDSFYQFVQAVWTKKCFDAPCANGIKAITATMASVVANNLKQDPEKSRFEVQSAVGKLYVPKLQAEIDASKARTGGVKPSV